MKFFHISDLHLGKTLNGFSLLDDQKYILNQIVDEASKNSADAVLISGDIYDKSVASNESIVLFNDFLRNLNERGLKVLVISGNHDSAERLSFGSVFMKKAEVFINPLYDGKVEKVTLTDEFGNVNFYLLPFLRASQVRRFYENEKIESLEDSVKVCIQNMKVDTKERNVLLCHQFVIGAKRCDSEEISIGTVENIGFNIFDDFDYVALGHIHSPQKIGRETIRYCGTPLKYSASEINDTKSISVINIEEKGKIEVSTIELKPLHELRKIKGKFEDIIKAPIYDEKTKDDFVQIILTDETPVYDAMNKLSVFYSQIINLSYEKDKRLEKQIQKEVEIKESNPIELLKEFFESRTNQSLTEYQEEIVSEIFEKLMEEK